MTARRSSFTPATTGLKLSMRETAGRRSTYTVRRKSV
jgi:hypothetical protein